MTKLSKILLPGALMAGAALSLGACGKQADLQRPAPLFGKARADAGNANRPSLPGSLQENRDPATSNATNRESHLPGAAPDPFGGPSAPGFPGSGPGRD